MAATKTYSSLIDAAWDELRTSFDLKRTSLGLATVAAAHSKDHPKIVSLRDHVLRDEKLRPLVDAWLRYPSGGSILQVNSLLYYMMLARANRYRKGSEIRELRNFAKAGESGQTRTFALGGVSVSGSLWLASDLVLIPWAHVRDSPGKANLVERIGALNEPFDVAPSAALMWIRPKSRVLFASMAEASSVQSPARQDRKFREDEEYVRSAISFLTVFTLRRVLLFGKFTSYTDPVAHHLSSEGVSWSFHRGPTPAVSLEDESIRRLFNKFLKFSQKPGRAVRAACRKLSEAAARESLVDKAIDLGTILEMLLLHDLKERGELSYRIRVRGATFLARGPERIELYRKLGKIYELRSAAAHDGEVSNNESTRNTLDEGMAICATLIKKIVALGEFPNWEHDCILAIGKNRSDARSS